MSSSRGEILNDALEVAGQMSWALDKIRHTLYAGDVHGAGESVTELLKAKARYDKLIEEAAKHA